MLKQNLAGKDVFGITNGEKLDRFINLGTNTAQFSVKSIDYVSEYKQGNFKYMADTIEEDPNVFFDMLRKYRDVQCKKVEPLIFLLAFGATYKTGEDKYLGFRNIVYHFLDQICKIPTTLHLFIHYCKQIMQISKGTTGWNNLHKNALRSWYKQKAPLELAYLVTKYPKRHGYSTRDIFRLLHIVPECNQEHVLYKFIVNGEIDNEHNADVGLFLEDFKNLSSPEMTVDKICLLINKHKFTHEHIPNHLLNDADIWFSLIQHIPSIALLRNLNKITSIGLLRDINAKQFIIQKIMNMKNINPITLLITIKMYAIGTLTWKPDNEILNVLNQKFMETPVETKNKSSTRICCALDVSGSMQSSIFGADCLSAIEATTALAMLLKKRYGDNIDIMGFSNNFVLLDISPEKSLIENIKNISDLPFGNTDISLPFTWAEEHQQKYDTFLVMTDNETNANTIDPIQALEKYKKTIGVDKCGLIVLATTANDISIGSSSNKNVLNIAGFNETVPLIVEEFIATCSNS